jgi:hypothetical protein
LFPEIHTLLLLVQVAVEISMVETHSFAQQAKFKHRAAEI